MIIYDCEIIKAIPPRKGEERQDDIDYCDGWRDFANMGISVIGSYDYIDGRYRVFAADNFDQFQQLANERDVVISFNGHGFDDRLCKANGLDITTTFDLLAELWAAAGLAREFGGQSHWGFGLDAASKANGGTGKTGDGALAPVDWQRGKIGNVIDYCLEDVRLTKNLIDRVLRCGMLRHPREADEILKVPRP